MSPLISTHQARGKKPFQGVWRATFPLQVSTRKAGPRALDIPMIRPETGRDDGGDLPARAFLIETPARGAPLCLPASPPQVGRLSPSPSRLYLKR